MKSEKEFKSEVLKNLNGDVFWQPLENHGQPGVPDLLYTVRSFVIADVPCGLTNLVELKFSTFTRGAHLRPSQRRWWERHLYAGGYGMIWVATRTDVHIYAGRDDLFPLIRKPSPISHLDWVGNSTDSIPVTHSKLWFALKSWMIRPWSDGRSIWDPDRQGNDEV